MSQAWKWGIAIGFLIAFVGLIIIPSAFLERNPGEDLLGAGLAIFAIGVLIMAISFYFHARSLQTQGSAETGSSVPSTSKQRRLVCDVCHKSTAVIQCTMHKTVLCPSCLAGHYDSRGCVYVPTIRRVSKTARGAVASRN